jgi:hypothetical protein
MLPYIRFVTGLKSLGYNYTTTRNICLKYKYPTLSEEYFININSTHFDKWVALFKEGWENKEKYRDVFYKMFFNAVMRYKLFALLTAQPDVEKLSKVLIDNGFSYVTEDNLILFKKWFWDTDIMEEKDWDHIFLNSRFPSGVLDKINVALFEDEMDAFFDNGIFPKADPDALLNGTIAFAYKKMRDMLSDPVKRSRVSYDKALKDALKSIEILISKNKNASASEIDPHSIIDILNENIKYKRMDSFRSFNELKDEEGDK